MKEGSQARVLLVDDDPSLRRVVEYQLGEAGYAVVGAETGEQAIETLRREPFDLLLTDVLMPGMDGITLVDRARMLRPDTAAIVITAHGDVATAVRAMQLGALDFLEKPFTRDRLLVSIRRALEFVGLRDENRRLRAAVQEHGGFESIVGTSSPLRRVMSDLALAADSDATVLLLGESGTGKELAAKAIHLRSRRKDGPFAVVNCAAIPEGLVESELFGHRRGSFTGATEDRRGKFETASGGTLFLDEVAELPLPVQPRLLRALQEGEVDKVGAPSPVRVDVRLVAATHADLEARVKEGAFREDLYYRLNVVPLLLPPLRERREDIPLLVEHFLLKHAKRHGRPIPKFEPEVLDRFDRYPWPGNVRELENVVERLLVLSREPSVSEADLPEALLADLPTFGRVRLDIPPDGISLEEVEKGLLVESLRRSQGNQTRAARFLGISRQTLIYRLKKFGLG
ncbi:MAG: sigma-54 dependent transcriptional regulator [Acidobacteriia bacterium]|nr:sigma-54 dependent transcriptional regulator [Terriglobia bacterium]